MDARKFLDHYGPEKAEEVAKKAGTSLAYFRILAGRHRRPSANLAKRLVEASKKELNFTELMSVRLRHEDDVA
jgi:hypothetical protein